MDADDVVIVGSIGGPYGLRGWVHVKSQTQPAGNLMHYAPWLVHVGGRWQARHPNRVKSHGSGLVATFSGVVDRNQAALMAGTELAVPRNALPDPDVGEYYWRDLQGLVVFDQSGRSLGKISRLMDIGAHAVLVVDGESGATLIPFVARHVLHVDLDGGRVDVDWLDPE